MHLRRSAIASMARRSPPTPSATSRITKAGAHVQVCSAPLVARRRPVARSGVACRCIGTLARSVPRGPGTLTIATRAKRDRAQLGDQGGATVVWSTIVSSLRCPSGRSRLARGVHLRATGTQRALPVRSPVAPHWPRVSSWRPSGCAAGSQSVLATARSPERPRPPSGPFRKWCEASHDLGRAWMARPGPPADRGF
jgi:hypothetical protein